jgi:hypothetical protein
MGALNAHAVFVAMMAVLQAEWLATATKAGLKHCGSQVIVNDILLWAASVRVLLEFFPIVPSHPEAQEVPVHHTALRIRRHQLGARWQEPGAN